MMVKPKPLRQRIQRSLGIVGWGILDAESIPYSLVRICCRSCRLLFFKVIRAFSVPESDLRIVASPPTPPPKTPPRLQNH